MIRLIISLCTFIILSGFFSQEAFAQEELKKRAQIHIDNQDYGKAIELLEQVLAEFPDDVENKKILAKLYGYVKDYEKSIKLYQSLLEQYENDNDIRFGLAQVYGWQGDYEQAENLYLRIISDDPGYDDAYTNLARVYFWQNKYNKTIELLIGLPPDKLHSSENLELLVQAEYESGNNVESRKYVRQLLIMDPASVIGNRFKSILKLYSVEIGGGYDNISTQDNWNNNGFTFQYKPSRNLTSLINYSGYKRYGKKDQQISLDSYLSIRPVNLHGSIGFGLNKKFLPTNRFNLDISFEKNRAVGMIGTNYLNFPLESVWVTITGLEYYFLGNVYSEYKHYFSKSKSGNTSRTHLFRMHYLIDYKVHIYCGFASGGEAYQFASEEELLVTKSSAYLTGMTFHVNHLIGIRFSYSYTDREDSYTRQSFNSSLILNF
ncbi:YaiO family outer membrane beta-barrel protein [candidate division KSB1 bacterium]